MTFCAKIKEGKFVVTSEIGPPKGTDLKEMLAGAELIHRRVGKRNGIVGGAEDVNTLTLASLFPGSGMPATP